jgi:Asp-tRNA(Asn)/Glu-tRNA(Gln) amidotransferase C subunit
MNAIERIKLPKPDTHCFDTDTDSDVWSYSPELVRETVLTHIDKLEKLAEERLQNCAALVAEVERLRAEVTRPESTDMTLMRALVQSQATELERLRKDAERKPITDEDTLALFNRIQTGMRFTDAAARPFAAGVTAAEFFHKITIQ